MLYGRYLNHQSDNYINISDFVSSVGYGMNYNVFSCDISFGYRYNNAFYHAIASKEEWQEPLIRPSISFSILPESGNLKGYSFKIQGADVITYSGELKQFNTEISKKIDQYISLSLSYNIELDHYNNAPWLNQTRQLTSANVGISW